MPAVTVQTTRYSLDPVSTLVRVYGTVAPAGLNPEPYQASVDKAVWLAAPNDAARAQLAADALFSAYQAFTAQTAPGWRRTFTYQETGPGG